MGKIGKIVTIVLWVLLIISAVLIVSLMVNISDIDTDPTMLSWINTNLIWVYILLIAGAGLAIISGLVQTVSDKKAAKNGIISLAFLGAVALVSFLLASPEMPQFIGVNKFINAGLTGQVVKMIDAGLYATYILLGLAILSILSSSLTRFIK
ncbi:MAG: hypothetical protein L3J11_10260 [Draconibacterium sp.]|nr:hypothetical protein [Draconibacterium sp.]